MRKNWLDIVLSGCLVVAIIMLILCVVSYDRIDRINERQVLTIQHQEGYIRNLEKVVGETLTRLKSLEMERNYYKTLSENYWGKLQAPITPQVRIEYEEKVIQLRYFISVDELKEFLNADDTNTLIPSYPLFDCDDYAQHLQMAAAKAGYFISTELDWKNSRLHMLNSAIIGNELWFIEPQTDKIWMRTIVDK